MRKRLIFFAFSLQSTQLTLDFWLRG